MQQGWVSIHRSIIENFVWRDKPFNMGAAWIDLIMMANHEEKKMPHDGQLMIVKRGQTFTSVRSLSERWGWSRMKVSRFLVLLEQDEMLILERSKSGTLLTLVNYDNYQDCRDTNGTPTRQNNNVNNDKNVKNEKKEKKDIYDAQISEIIDYFNQVAGKHYTGRSESHRKCITARLKEGYTVEEFKQVIDNMTREWMGDEKMERYLCPETIFNGKFETRLNNTETKAQKEKRETDELHERQIEAIRANELDWLYHQT